MKASRIASASAIMAAGTVVSRILGFVRIVVLNEAIGLTTAVGNAFGVANGAPTVLYLVILGGALNAVVVPQIVQASKSADGGTTFLNRFITLSLWVMALVTVVLTVSAPLIVDMYTLGRWPAEWTRLAVIFALICLPQVFFYGLYTVIGQILNARSSFGPYMWAPAANNVISIAVLGAFIAVYGSASSGTPLQPQDFTWPMVWLLAGGSTAAIAAQAIVLLPFLRRVGYRYRPDFRLSGVGLGVTSKVAGWTFAMVIVGQLVFILIWGIAAGAARLAEESGDPALLRATPGVPVYDQAFMLFILPHSVIVVSLVTALFTRMSTSMANADPKAVADDMSLSLRIIGVVNVVATAGLLAFAEPIANLLADNAAESHALATVVMTMGLGLLPFSANYALQRVFYAASDGRTPFMANLPNLVTVVALSLASWFLLPIQYKVVGVGLALSAGYVVGLAVIWPATRRILPTTHAAAVLGVWAKLVPVGVVVGFMAWYAQSFAASWYDSGRLQSAVVVAGGGLLMVGAYGAAAYVLRVREVADVVQRLARRRA